MECVAALQGSRHVMSQPRNLALLSRHLWSRSRLDRFVDLELSPSDQLRIREHLHECKKCEGDVAALLGLKEALRARVGLGASADAIERLEAWISDEMPSVLG